MCGLSNIPRAADRKYCEDCRSVAAAQMAEGMKGNKRGTMVTKASKRALAARMAGNQFAKGHSHPFPEEHKQAARSRMMGNELAHMRTSEGLARQAQFMRERTVTAETRENMSAGWFKSPRVPSFKNVFEFEGNLYRSRWECAVAHFLTQANIIWSYETTTYVWKRMSYTPDFFIYNQQGTLTRIIEVKGYPNGRDYLKHKALKTALPGVKIRMWVERHMMKFGLLELLKSKPFPAKLKSLTFKPPRATSSLGRNIVRINK